MGSHADRAIFGDESSILASEQANACPYVGGTAGLSSSAPANECFRLVAPHIADVKHTQLAASAKPHALVALHLVPRRGARRRNLDSLKAGLDLAHRFSRLPARFHLITELSLARRSPEM